MYYSSACFYSGKRATTRAEIWLDCLIYPERCPRRAGTRNTATSRDHCKRSAKMSNHSVKLQRPSAGVRSTIPPVHHKTDRIVSQHFVIEGKNHHQPPAEAHASRQLIGPCIKALWVCPGHMCWGGLAWEIWDSSVIQSEHPRLGTSTIPGSVIIFSLTLIPFIQAITSADSFHRQNSIESNWRSIILTITLCSVNHFTSHRRYTHLAVIALTGRGVWTCHLSLSEVSEVSSPKPTTRTWKIVITHLETMRFFLLMRRYLTPRKPLYYHCQGGFGTCQGPRWILLWNLRSIDVAKRQGLDAAAAPRGDIMGPN